jgi:hypothetical protein
LLPLVPFCQGEFFEKQGDRKMTRDEFIEFRLQMVEWSKGNFSDFFTGAINEKIQQKKAAIIVKLDQMKKLSDEICEEMGWQ